LKETKHCYKEGQNVDVRGHYLLFLWIMVLTVMLLFILCEQLRENENVGQNEWRDYQSCQQ